jgi:hypothetical protein
MGIEHCERKTMPITSTTPVKDLVLDRHNFRTVSQSDELHAVQAIIAIHEDWFWALTGSLIDDGYLPIESILVLRQNDSTLVVKEGNRRIAALKLIHGYLPVNSITIPNNIKEKIAGLPIEWKKSNEQVPCTIYANHEIETVDRIVMRVHGKGEKAGRDPWNAVARARHNRDINKASEPGLDLLEKYLKVGQNITIMEAGRWAGAYPLTVLTEAIKRIAPQVGARNAPELARNYPSIQYREAMEKLIKDIGKEFVGFETVRDKSVDFATKYGIPPKSSTGGTATKTNNASSQGGSTQGQAGSTSKRRAIAAVATHDPRAVKRTLRQFFPTGNNRQKVAALRDEALKLDLSKTPMAFCFLLRSMFEISAKLYCDDHKANNGPSATEPNGRERKLVEVLKDVTQHLTTPQTGKQDQAMIKALHGAMVELAKPEGILSVTSMNQLIHNPKFSVAPSDISTTFGNVFPLLEAMNI